MMVTLNLGKRIFLSIIAMSALSIVIVVVPMLVSIQSNYREIGENEARLSTVQMAAMSVPAVIFDRPDMAQTTLNLLEQSDNVNSAAILIPAVQSNSQPLSIFAFYGNYDLSNKVYMPERNITTIRHEGSNLVSMTPIYSGGDVVGFLQMTVTVSHIDQYFHQALLYVVIAAIIAVSVGIYSATFFRKTIMKPISGLHDLTRAIAETKDYSRRFDEIYDDEVGDLIRSFNDMLTVIQGYDSAQKEIEFQVIQLNQNLEQKVADRTAELENNMEVLSKTIFDLRETQSKLVEQEKMASLGGLVAGVAHEINTPMGVAITASSLLENSIQSFEQKYTDGILTKSDMEDAIAELKEASIMITKNLERGAALVKSFKLVAVDQSSDDIREFDVKEYIENIVMSLKPQLRSTKHQVNIDIPMSVSAYSSPGALSQIMSNLIINSLFHGFETLAEGTIDIKGKANGDEMQIDYFDNGKGLDESIKKRIFEPFVTTARARGGSGLGTHILYNLVTQVLEGSVSIEEDVTQGVHFRIRFPLRLGSNEC